MRIVVAIVALAVAFNWVDQARLGAVVASVAMGLLLNSIACFFLLSILMSLVLLFGLVDVPGEEFIAVGGVLFLLRSCSSLPFFLTWLVRCRIKATRVLI